MKTNDINQSLNKTISLKPYVYKKPSISAVSIRMLILLSMQILMLFFTKTYSSLIIIGISILAGFLASYIHYLLTKQQYFSCLSSIIQGILIGMFLPQTYPPITAFFITLITLLIYKYIFGY